MAKFVFRLDSVKKFRENRVLLAKKELLRLESELLGNRNQMRDTVDERSADIDGSQRKVSAMRFAQLHADFVVMHSEKIVRVESEIQRLEEEVERQRRWLTHVGQELKILEKLEQKQREQFDARERTLEKRKMDAWVVERWKVEET